MNINQPAENVILLGVKPKRVDPNDTKAYHEHKKIDWLNYFPQTARNYVVAFIGEFVGTFMFLFFAFSATQVANTTTNASNASAGVSSAPNTSNLLFVALAFGFSLAVNAWVFFRITGGLFNPAVSPRHLASRLHTHLTYYSSARSPSA